MPAFSLLFLIGTFAHLEVGVLLIVSVGLEGDLLLRGVDVEVPQARPNRTGWGQPYKLRTRHVQQLQKISSMVSSGEVPAGVVVKAHSFPASAMTALRFALPL